MTLSLTLPAYCLVISFVEVTRRHKHKVAKRQLPAVRLVTVAGHHCCITYDVGSAVSCVTSPMTCVVTCSDRRRAADVAQLRCQRARQVVEIVAAAGLQQIGGTQPEQHGQLERQRSTQHATSPAAPAGPAPRRERRRVTPRRRVALPPGDAEGEWVRHGRRCMERNSMTGVGKSHALPTETP